MQALLLLIWQMHEEIQFAELRQAFFRSKIDFRVFPLPSFRAKIIFHGSVIPIFRAKNLLQCFSLQDFQTRFALLLWCECVFSQIVILQGYSNFTNCAHSASVNCPGAVADCASKAENVNGLPR